jgi:hypothetical protein
MNKPLEKTITFCEGEKGKRRDYDHSPAHMFAKIQAKLKKDVQKAQ